ncbi:hypothetical protein HAX54_016708 [Datura stramonium]|uniref:Uncharacterized protein n=1 Tax=Datura stramonium TaxID=4076 RepID=A0ABS8ULN6_DATST|nr:hypothetical protein [Datura stramonium]
MSGNQEEDSDPPTTPEARWMENTIMKAKEEAKAVTSGKPIYKASLNCLAKSLWSIFRDGIAPAVNDNVLNMDREALVACII